jgi:hypothetical protein
MPEGSRTPEEKLACYDTLMHIDSVRNIINIVIVELLKRAKNHDREKLSEPELSHFAAAPNLATMTFESPEYLESRKMLETALKHHYARCRHHPEHHEEGIDGMNLIDLVEMFCDWKASSLRQHDGNLLMSIEKSTERFKLSDQLSSIFKNTADLLDQIHA